MITIYALLAGFGLDLLFGDPLSFPHPVRLIGRLIVWLEQFLRRLFPKTPKGERIAGRILAFFLPVLLLGSVFGILWAAGGVGKWLRFLVETLFCYQALAAKSLATESNKVYRQLRSGNLVGARRAVSMIVGRDTKALDAEGVTKATVETVAENTADGVVAPLFYLAIGGAPLGLCYKAINTMDSMIGYKNERYLHFGRAAARLDDLANFIPARLSGLLLLLSGWILRMDWRNGWKIFCRDRFNHASPNSAQSESAVAGILQVQLAGDAYYFGKLHPKPFIGEAIRPIVPEDILKSNRLMFCTAGLCLLLCTILRWSAIRFLP